LSDGGATRFAAGSHVGLPEIVVVIVGGVVLGAAMCWLAVTMALRLARRRPPESDPRRTSGGSRRNGG
jgi:hypothetical protein